ncbi:MAG: hypothetical protein ACI3WQ_03115 [Faecousia sp.]
MEELISAIMQANEDEIEKILRTAIRRKRQLYPDWNIIYQATLRSGAGERNEEEEP